MPTEIINNNTVIDVNHANSAFLIDHSGLGNGSISPLRIDTPNRNGQLVRAVPIGSDRPSCIDPTSFAHVIETDNDFVNLFNNQRHVFRTTVLNFDVNLAGGANVWFDSGIDLGLNDRYYVITTNLVDICGGCPVMNADSDGISRPPWNVDDNFGHMALLGRFVNPANGAVLNGPFFVGASFADNAPVAGRLQLRHNDTTTDNFGFFHCMIRSIDTPMPTDQFAFDFRPGQGCQKYVHNGVAWQLSPGENIFTEFGANQFIYDEVSKTVFYTRDMNTLFKIGQRIVGLTNDYLNVDLALDNTTRFTLTSPNGNRWVITNNTLRNGITSLVGTPVGNF